MHDGHTSKGSWKAKPVCCPCPNTVALPFLLSRVPPMPSLLLLLHAHGNNANGIP